ncbi:MAG: cytochrome c [Gammaproteobacteria bacterium]|nr:cytochrome c [Gammaproteobacteria bacterium]MDH3766825.1 cytochrome c [Gammaproteobacteria bacterium]
MRVIYSMALVLAVVACSAPAPVVEDEIQVTGATSTGCIDETGWAYSANRGAAVFSENCAYCHQADGSGQTGQVPRLAGNKALLADPTRGIRLILITRSGSARSHGMEVQDMVAIFSELNDGDIADVMTYVLSSWDNCAGPVVEDDIKAVAAALARE